MRRKQGDFQMRTPYHTFCVFKQRFIGKSILFIRISDLNYEYAYQFHMIGPFEPEKKHTHTRTRDDDNEEKDEMEKLKWNFAMQKANKNKQKQNRTQLNKPKCGFK